MPRLQKVRLVVTAPHPLLGVLIIKDVLSGCDFIHFL